MQAKVCSDSKVVGEEIARLESAKALLASVTAISSSNADLCGLKEWAAQADKGLQSAARDNDMIYHEQVLKLKKIQQHYVQFLWHYADLTVNMCLLPAARRQPVGQ